MVYANCTLSRIIDFAKMDLFDFLSIHSSEHGRP